MIDTMFFLLVFYILSSLALQHQESIPVNLPKAATGQETKEIELIVTITKEGEYYINKVQVSAQSVGSTLRNYIVQTQGVSAIPKATVIVNADLSVLHRQVVDVMDQCRSIGITKFAIATTPKAKPRAP